MAEEEASQPVSQFVGVGGPQVGQVTCLDEVNRLSIKSLLLI